MNTRRFLSLVTALATFVGTIRPTAHADIVNGSFETGDLTGWTRTASGGIYFRSVDPAPVITYPFDPMTNPWLAGIHAANAGVSPGGTGDNGSMLYSAYVPQYLPPIDYTFSSPDGVVYQWIPRNYTLSLQQDVTLNAGEVLSGWATLGTWDEPLGEDYASVTINGSTIWSRTIPTTLDSWMKDGDFNTWDMAPWQQWEWTVPATGMYTLSLNVYGDNQFGSRGYFDGIKVSPAPEPSTFTLVGLGAASLLISRRRS